LTDAQNFGDAFLARPTLAQRINLAAILILYSSYLLIGNLLQSQEVTPSSHQSIMRWLLESALRLFDINATFSVRAAVLLRA
jgi:hypothetical protein